MKLYKLPNNSMTNFGGSGYAQEVWNSACNSTLGEDKEDEQPNCTKEQDSREDSSSEPNLLFYQNKIRFEPNGQYIDYIHENWRYDYNMLETNHSFIQWLFPLKEPGMNCHATPFTLNEIQMMKADKQVMKRFLISYKLMLGFYGIVLLDEDTGEVARAVDWKDRFYNLNSHTHNNLRITRILKCLGEMGYEKYQAPLVRFFLEETLKNGKLRNVKQSALDYFLYTVKDEKEHQKLVHFARVNNKTQYWFIMGHVVKLLNILHNTVSGRKADSQRYGTCCLVSKTLVYISWPLFAVFRVFRYFMPRFRWSMWPFRFMFGGSFFSFGIKAKSKDGLNEEQFSIKTEGARTKQTWWDANMPIEIISVDYRERSQGDEESEFNGLDSIRQENREAELKELNISAARKSFHSMAESNMEAKLETQNKGSKHESVPDDGTGSEDREPLLNISMPKTSQGKGDDNDTENVDDPKNITKDSQSKNVIKLGKSPTSEEEKIGGVEKGSKEEGNVTENIEDSDGYTNTSERDKRGGDREDGGTQIGNQSKETERDNLNTEDKEASHVDPVPRFGGEEGNAESAEISKREGNRQEDSVGLRDNVEGTIGTQNTWPETDKTDKVKRDHGKTESEGTDNVVLSLQIGGEGGDSEISKAGNNGVELVQELMDNDGEKIVAQNTEPEKDKTGKTE